MDFLTLDLHNDYSALDTLPENAKKLAKIFKKLVCEEIVADDAWTLNVIFETPPYLETHRLFQRVTFMEMYLNDSVDENFKGLPVLREVLWY